MLPTIVVSNNQKNIEKIITDEKKDPKKLIIRITPKTSEFSIGQIKEIIKEIKMTSPYHRLYILEDFDHSSIEAQNAFLKTLEEASVRIKFILVVGNLHQLLPTILSRSKIILADKSKSIDIDKKIEEKLEIFLHAKSLKILSDQNFTVVSKDEALEKIYQIIVFFRKKLRTDPIASLIIKESFQVKDLIENNNLNSQLAIDHLLLYIKNKYS